MAGADAEAEETSRPRPAPQLALGVVLTDLLDSSLPLPLFEARQLLDLVPGVAVSSTEHPVPRVVSPEIPYGVDCALPARSAGKVRGVGTVSARAVLTGGHVLQASAHVRVLIGASQARQRWAYYAARTGVVEAINKAKPADLVDGFLDQRPGEDLLDLPAVGFHLADRIQGRPQVDRDAHLRSRSTRLVWAARLDPDAAAPSAVIEVDRNRVHRVRLVVRPEHLPDAVEFCEYLALHDWLLTTLQDALERSRRPDRRSDDLVPALLYLGHLWIPTSRLSPEMQALWKPLEKERKLRRELRTKVTQVRDQVSVLARGAKEEPLLKESI